MSDAQCITYDQFPDGRGIFPEDLRVKAPKGARAAIAVAAERQNTTRSEWVRQTILRALADDGVRLSRGRANAARLSRPNS